MEDWYHIDNIEGIDTPALVIYRQRVEENILRLVEMIDDVSRLRPHVKTHKCREVVQLQLNAGISKFKCATIAEAEMLGQLEAPDVLLAYQPVGPKTNRFINLVKKYRKTVYSCLVDDAVAARSLSEKAGSAGINIPVYIDLNVGMNRTGIMPGPEAIALYQLCSVLAAITPTGLHAYDGHIHDRDFAARKVKCDLAFEKVEALATDLKQNGFSPVKIIVGGSPTFPIHAKRKDVECSPGTFVYWDAGYEEALPEQPFLPAAVLLTRVISHPGERLLCTDLGHKSVAAEKDISNRARFLNLAPVRFVAQSEEHLVLETGGDYSSKIGDVLYAIPFHICPTCALYERAFVVENGLVTGEWKTVARDRRIEI